MATVGNMTLEDHLEWSENIKKRLQSIYKELCEFEASLSVESTQETPLQLMELLDTVNDIHTAAQSIRPVNVMLKSKQDNLQQEMEMLQRSVELLQLENKTKSIELVDP